jgi:hypothetical protein
LTRLGVIDDGPWILLAELDARFGKRRRMSPWRMDRGRLQGGKFWHPAAHIFTIGIKISRLCHRIKDSEVWLSVSATPRAPLPATIVGGNIAVDKMS